MSEHIEGDKPHVISLCGTYLKAEMQSIYRQIANLKRFRTTVYTEATANLDKFPFDPVTTMTKIRRPRLKGNFLLRFYYKYVVRQWPPPRPINKLRKPYYPYDIPDLLKSDAPDVVHVYYGHKAVKYREMLEAWGGPWVVSFHGVDVVKFFDEEGYHDEMRRVFAGAELVLARSVSLLGRLEALGCPREKLRLNRTPIPLDASTFKVRTPPADGHWRLIQACRLIGKKGLFTTLKALEHLAPDFPHLKFILCGTGPLAAKFQESAEAAGLAGRIEMKGWLGQDELRAEYARAHVFLHPSELTKNEDQEGVPNSMLEAMAAGLPVIATLHGGIPEAVESGRDGLLVPEKSPLELAGAIRRILTEPQSLAEFSRNAAASVAAKYGLENQVAALEDAYEEAVLLHKGRVEEVS